MRKKGEAEATRRGMKSGDVVCTVPLKPRAANELQQFAFLANAKPMKLGPESSTMPLGESLKIFMRRWMIPAKSASRR